MKATVLIPTFNHGPTLSFAVRSVLRQTLQDFELFIIGDGITEEGRKIAKEFEASDSRIRFFDNPKGERHGEIYRHQALLEASGEIVCYLSDDDIWLSHHLEEVHNGLQDSDFAHVLPITILPNDEVRVFGGDIDLPEYRKLMKKGKNYIPLCAGGHTMDVYKKLAKGWRTTPTGIYTDLYMWLRILDVPNCKTKTIPTVSMIHLSTNERKDWSQEKRLAELQDWEDRILEANGGAELTSKVLEFYFKKRAKMDLLYDRACEKLSNPNLLSEKKEGNSS